MIKEQIVKVLEAAKCPNSNCNQAGMIQVDYGFGGTYDIEPCKWCHDREALLKEIKSTEKIK